MSSAHLYTRNGMGTARAYLFGPRQLLGFITQAFGAEIVELVDGVRVNGCVRIDDAIISFSLGEPIDSDIAIPSSLQVFVANVDDVYTRAVSLGAESLETPNDKPYLERTSGVRDMAGNIWWISACIGDHTPIPQAVQPTDGLITRDAMLARITRNQHVLFSYLSSLTPTQRDDLRDTVGWSIKDHFIHIALWEKVMTWILQRKPRHAAVDLDEATWAQGYDVFNNILQQRYQSLTWDDTVAMFHTIHDQFLATINSLSDADLQLPFQVYQPDSNQTAPVIEWIAGNSYDHYVEHLPWMILISVNA